jgi:hypothetical protein
MQASPYRQIDIEPKRDRMLGRGVDLLRETSGNRRDFSVRLTGDGLDDGPRSARFHNRRSANRPNRALARARTAGCRSPRQARSSEHIEANGVMRRCVAPNNAFTNEERRVAALRNWMD